MSLSVEEVWQDVQSIRERVPLVHNITNYVAMEFTANALLALGASPVMAHAMEEVREIARISQALVINIGTLSAPWVQSMREAMKEAAKQRVPIVLDPVGCGASQFRTQTARELLATAAPTIIRGNASEIIALGSDRHETKGVDSLASSEQASEIAGELSARYGCAVSISGAVDLIVQGAQVVRVRNGTPLMTRVTAMGCTASALTGAFAACNPSPVHAAAHAMVIMGIAGELGARRAQGVGSLPMHFLDALHGLSKADVQALMQAG
ncbi:hydroxyethylthiazole kinase [Corallococcus exiguus]|uniref:hydroxyethylthiazole kinase n=1 Tax=Corallococcus exiguus TaxID=83462 RepID=UPI001471DCCB|nr:hydroxyethylthiazole kinase [Corallococcus exiguus]NNB94887.1 hydroxyethylthiazole kinase [Corallococcus exiguus]NNC02618.1 hydroxyethylthiazole kinase [Corallococcus exiguus]